MSDIVQSVQVSIKLRGNLDVFKRLHGERWAEIMADIGTALEFHMLAISEPNPIAAAIPIAKQMSQAGENPMLFLAVATDLALRDYGPRRAKP